jgi:hypothetical protein
MLRRTLALLPAIAAAAVVTAALSPVDTADPGTATSTDHAEYGEFTATDGDVTVVGEAILAPSALQLGTAPKLAAATTDVACTDSTYALASWKLPSTLRWYYNPTGAPATVASTALTAIRNATATTLTARYRCGSTTNLGLSNSYLGTSTRVAQVSTTATCSGNDGVSVVSWGTLPTSVLAYTCVYYSTASKTVLATDVLIDNKYHQWFTSLPSGCSNQYDLESVMVHERGHSAGLAHVDQATRSMEAMSPITPACSTARRTLALGDVKGLQAKYLG